MGLLKIAQRFLEERKKWKQAGAPTRSSERIQELFNICSSNECGQYIKITDNHGQCGICQCHLKVGSVNLNKLAYATTRCPHDPPFWVEEDEFNPEKKVEQAPQPPPPIHHCGCH